MKFSVRNCASIPTERESAVSMRLINYIDCACQVEIWNGLQPLLTEMPELGKVFFKPLIFCGHK